MNVVLCTLILVALQPGMGDVASYGETLGAGGTPTEDVSGLIFPPVVSLTALSIATLLSVYKPWGRVRRRTPPATVAGSTRLARPVPTGQPRG